MLVACKGTASTDTASTASVTSAVTSAAVVAPPPTVAAASTSVAAPTPSASAAPADSGPPAWLHLAPGEKFKARDKVGGCVTIVTKNGEEGRCEPMPAPAATVDDLTLPHGRDCPAGFAVSGSRYCSRVCKTNADCHAKHSCESGQCVKN